MKLRSVLWEKRKAVRRTRIENEQEPKFQSLSDVEWPSISLIPEEFNDKEQGLTIESLKMGKTENEWDSFSSFLVVTFYSCWERRLASLGDITCQMHSCLQEQLRLRILFDKAVCDWFRPIWRLGFYINSVKNNGNYTYHLIFKIKSLAISSIFFYCVWHENWNKQRLLSWTKPHD